MKFIVVVLFVSYLTHAKRIPRDIGLDLSHHHDYHHEHQDKGDASKEVSIKQKSAQFGGYGRDIPIPPLSVDLQQPLAPPEQNNPEVPRDFQKAVGAGYPRENPSNPLQYPVNSNGQELQSSDIKETISGNLQQSEESQGAGIPGEAGKDFPIYATVPETSFSCKNQEWPGYYADEEARCQVFHICHDNRKASFLCPNGTLFNQKFFVCDWWYNVDCAASKNFFSLNSMIGVVPEKSSADIPNNPEEKSQPFQNLQKNEQNLLLQQSSDSLLKEAPVLSYLPPSPSGTETPLNEKPFVELASPEPKAPEISPSTFDSLPALPEISQEYLPPLQQQPPQYSTGTPLESLAPTETATEEPLKSVEIPETSYLPPLNSVEPKVPPTEQSAPENLQPPSPDYLPPLSSAAAEVPPPPIPPQVANIPTAMEAIANGILEVPQPELPLQSSARPDEKADLPIAAPNLSYLPPAL